MGVFLGGEGKIVGYPLLQSGPESMKIRTSVLRRGLFVLWAGWGKRKRERAENDEKGKQRRDAPAFSLFPSSPTSFLFFFFSDDCYFYRDTQHEPLRRRENQKNVLLKNHANRKFLECHADI